MTLTDLYLSFQKESNYSLDTIIHMAANRDREYVEWLEDKIIKQTITFTLQTKDLLGIIEKKDGKDS